jgi:hypothetical protein
MVADDRKLLGAVAVRKEYLLAEALTFTVDAVCSLPKERCPQINVDQMKSLLASLSPEARHAARDEVRGWLQYFRRS